MKIITVDIKTKCKMCRTAKTTQRYEMTYNGVTVQLPICEECQQLPNFRLQDMLLPLLDSISRCTKYAHLIETYENDILKMHADEVKRDLHKMFEENGVKAI